MMPCAFADDLKDASRNTVALLGAGDRPPAIGELVPLLHIACFSTASAAGLSWFLATVMP